MVTPQNPNKTQETILAFHEDLHHRIPTICGNKWVLPLSIHKLGFNLNSAKLLDNTAGHGTNVGVRKVKYKIDSNHLEQTFISLYACHKKFH